MLAWDICDHGSGFHKKLGTSCSDDLLITFQLVEEIYS